MNEIGSLVSFLFDPIAITGWVLAALTVVVWRRPVGMLVRLSTTAWTLLLFALGSPVIANALLGWVEDQATVSCAAPPEDAIIIVLAGGVQGSASEPKQYEKLKEASISRVLPAVRQAKELNRSTLLMTGGLGGAVREADLMAALASDLGIPPDRIWVEHESTSTASSARGTKALIDAKGGVARSVYLVTSASHMPRAAAAFRAVGLDVCTLPVDFRRLHPPMSEGWVPRITALWKSVTACREIAGGLVYQFLGRFQGASG